MLFCKRQTRPSSKSAEVDPFLQRVLSYRSDWRIARVKKDGNCLFRCFALIIGEDPDSHHGRIRQMFVEYMKRNASDMRQTFVVWGEQYEFDFETHCDHMSKESDSRGFGTDFELKLFAMLTKLKVICFTRDGMIALWA